MSYPQIDELIGLFDEAKQSGEISSKLPNESVVAFFESTLHPAWKRVQTGDATTSEATEFTKYLFFNGCTA